MRAMLELLWIKTLAPVALSMDLVPQPLLALRLFLVHMHSDVLHLENLVQMEQQQKATTAKSSGKCRCSDVFVLRSVGFIVC